MGTLRRGRNNAASREDIDIMSTCQHALVRAYDCNIGH